MIIGFTIVIALLFIFTAENTVLAIEYTNYISEKYNIQFEYPKNWHIVEKSSVIDEDPLITISDPMSSSIIFIGYNDIILQSMPLKEVLESMLKAGKSDIKIEIKEVIESPSLLTIDNHTAGTFVVTIEPKFGVDMKKNTNRTWIVPTTNHTYQIIYKSNPEVFDSTTNIEIRDHFIKSINFLEDNMSIQAAPNFVAQNDSNNTINTFEDPKTGISIQYPSDWEIASKEFSEALDKSTDEMLYTLSDQQISQISTTVVDIYPKSLNGAMLGITSELLPFPIPLEQYMELNIQSLKMDLGDISLSLSKSIPVSIGNLNGLKYNLTFPDNSFTQTQIAFVKDSKAFIIFYNLGETEQSKHIDDINLIINSFKIR
ncbi:MAG TPA: hypothetical protein VLA74_11675 [Nitrososphaeraceae archaeon]|nr:hypothetical protein [Nitrososphaeraceae archaeon]